MVQNDDFLRQLSSAFDSIGRRIHAQLMNKSDSGRLDLPEEERLRLESRLMFHFSQALDLCGRRDGGRMRGIDRDPANSAIEQFNKVAASLDLSPEEYRKQVQQLSQSIQAWLSQH